VSYALLAPLVPVLLIIGTDVWVYFDESTQCERGTPVVFRFGALRLDRPAEWVVACTVMWIIFFPLYLIGRRS
jgi:cytochrome c oxidase assembly factor CtaG